MNRDSDAVTLSKYFVIVEHSDVIPECFTECLHVSWPRRSSLEMLRRIIKKLADGQSAGPEVPKGTGALLGSLVLIGGGGWFTYESMYSGMVPPPHAARACACCSLRGRVELRSQTR